MDWIAAQLACVLRAARGGHGMCWVGSQFLSEWVPSVLEASSKKTLGRNMVKAVAFLLLLAPSCLGMLVGVSTSVRTTHSSTRTSSIFAATISHGDSFSSYAAARKVIYRLMQKRDAIKVALTDAQNAEAKMSWHVKRLSANKLAYMKKRGRTLYRCV